MISCDLILDNTLNTGALKWISDIHILHTKTRTHILMDKTEETSKDLLVGWIWEGLQRALCDSDSPYDEWHCPTKLDPFHLRSHSIYYMEDANFSCQKKHGFTRNQVYLYSKQS